MIIQDSATAVVLNEPLSVEHVEDLMVDMNEYKKVARAKAYVSPFDKLCRVAPTDTLEPGLGCTGKMASSTMAADDYDEPSSMTPGSSTAAVLPVENLIFSPGDTVLVQGVTGYEPDGVTEGGELVVLVTEVDNDECTITVRAVNGKRISAVMNCVPSVPAGASLLRMGTARSSSDTRTSSMALLPASRTNYCQFFSKKVEVDDDALRALKAAGVDWTIDDMVCAAKSELLRGRDACFLMGRKGRLYDSEQEANILTTGGVWKGDTPSIRYDDGVDGHEFYSLMHQCLQPLGLGSKVLIAGIGLKSIIAGFGIEKDLSANLGIEVVYSPLLDECVGENQGLLVNRGELVKYEYSPLREEWNADHTSCVLSECSCVFALSEKSVMRILQR